MIFLIEYNRPSGDLLKLTSFADEQREQAEVARLTLELALNAKALSHEVVLLEARNEAALRSTHQRYFESLQSIAASMSSSARSASAHR